MSEKRKHYKSDLSDEEWKVIEPLLPDNDGPGRPMELDLREVVNAIFYLNYAGCQWRALPGGFPNWNSVYYYFRKWTKDGTWRAINAALCRLERKKRGREPQPTGAVIDTQSVETTALAQERGFDGYKRVKGHKRHILTDTVGNVLDVVVQTADIPDCKGAPSLVEKVAEVFPKIKNIWADGAYQGDLIGLVKRALDAVLEIVENEAEEKGFQVLPKRWVIERTFGWFEWYRRLSKDFERLLECSESMIYIASSRLMLKRLTA